MTAFSVLDLDDAASLEAADSRGALRAAALGGAQVRSVAAAVREDVLARLVDLRPRTVLMVTGTGRSARAASLLVAALGEGAGLPLVHVPSTPPWVGPLDVVVVAGDDAGDQRLVESVGLALRRGAEVVVAAPDEGPLRAAAAGRATAVPPRVQVRDRHGLLRYLAVGIAVLAAVDPARSAGRVPDLDRLADLLDAEAIRDHPRNEVFHNPAKALAARMQNRRVVFAGDTAATDELAAHGAEMMLRGAGAVAAAVDLADAVAIREFAIGADANPDYDPFFHDEQIDGPAPQSPLRVFVLSTAADRAAVERRLAILADAELLTAEPAETETVDGTDSPSFRSPQAGPATGTSPQAVTGAAGKVIEQLAVLVVRLEMAAAYLRLLSGAELAERPVGADHSTLLPGTENEEESV